ncbi:putative acetamidase formamidase [Rosellinia necatrix]|uniref:Putative acetamidase formamidase n=1 Tax=Rosellinia necatrix TaxID=77044 RepID=A0A1W2TSL3_ROSNE|nr:putative acetamidase formamidase [Rosellinia necatrix]
MASSTKSHFHLHNHPGNSHFRWSRSIPPVLTVPSGAEITLELPDGGGNQVTRENAAAGTTIADFDVGQADPGLGPIYVEGAEPGDVLRVELLAAEPLLDYGWTVIFPGFGLLSDEFPSGGGVKIFEFGAPGRDDWVVDRGYVAFRAADAGAGREEIRIPYRPFLGLVGLAPAEGEPSTIPPMPRTGGNIDTRWAGVGSALYLPVEVPGALLSLGDGHAAQGDGEVCGTAIEARMRATVRITVEKAGKKKWVQSPWVLTAKRDPAVLSQGDGEFMCLGVDSDIREATRKAVRGVMDWLEAEKALSRAEAYMLVSIAGNLRMCEVVDMPNYAIGCALPLDIFVALPVES